MNLHEKARSKMETILDSLVSRGQYTHAVLAVESIDQSSRWIGAAGDADGAGTPMTPQTPFFIASIDKLLNAVIAMRLCERGLLALDAPIAKWLPAELTRGLHRMDGVDRSDALTVRHLLTHTSGLPDWLEESPRGGRSVVESIVEDGDREFSIEEVVSIVRDQLTPHFAPSPGTARRQHVRYSDTNYMLLVAILESAAGRPLHQLHEEMIFRPLDLGKTYFEGYSKPVDQSLPPSVLRVDGRPLPIPLLIRSFRGIYSTAEDLLGFMRGLIQGRIFDDPESLSVMTARWNRFGLPMDRAALRAPGWPIEYGLGLMRFRLPRIFTPLSAVPEVVGHSGSTGCWLFHCPERDLLLAGSVDEVSAGALPYRIVPRILRAIPSL